MALLLSLRDLAQKLLFLNGRFSATHQYLHSTTHSFRLQSYYIFLTPTNIFSKKIQKKQIFFLQ